MDLSNNRLTALPAELSSLTALTTLDLSRNQLTALPAELSSLTGLTALNLGGNQLTEVPAVLSSLTGLATLHLHDNHLTTLPAVLSSLTGLTGLWLNNNHLTTLPAELSSLTGLTVLYLENNHLTTLPAVLSSLTGLTALSLAGNRLTTLPAVLSSLTGLTALNLGGNQLTEVPAVLSSLTGLATLHLHDNHLTTLPAVLSSLTGLTGLYLHGNLLTTVPAVLSSLTGLTALSIDNNGLTTVPAELSSLTGLEVLWLNDNHLTTVPAELSSLTGLTALYLENNQLTTLPAELSSLTGLTTLNLENNRLTALPAELSSLTDLTYLSLSGNPLAFPPIAIIEQGTSAILSFLKQVLEEKKPIPVWASKLLLVGEGKVGKTSLLRKLRRKSFRKKEVTTHGIEIQDLPLPHPEIKRVEMKLTAWDFGGQEIYHATHQFFLTDRSLFLLVWNMRTGYEASKLEYWLETIKAKAPESPVMLVATEIDDGRPVDLPLKDLKARFPQIAGLWEVSNAKGDGIGELRRAIGRVAAGLPLMGERWPKAWLEAAEAIRARAERHISPFELFRIMSDHDIREEDRGILARWLHELGDILYYRDNPELNDVVILKPQWVNQEICKVLDSKEVKKNGGVFRQKDRDQLWTDIDPDLHDLFLRLMDQFDLSYRIESPYRTRADPDLSLVVEHLSLDEHPAAEKTWQDFGKISGGNQITMKFILSVMPPGIPTWFIARSHRFTQTIHWKRGAIFGEPREKPEHLGFVRTSPEDRTVILRVRGPFPHNYFAVLRDGLEQTLKRFPGMEITRKLPCPCQGDDNCPGEFDLRYLQRAMVLKPPILEAQCPVTFKMVSIQELLFGLDWRHDEPVLQKLDQLVDGQEGLRDEVRELRSLAQREFSRTLINIQKLIESDCPPVFVLRPKGGGGWRKWTIGRKAELQLYCDAPGHWHPPAKGGRYEIDVPPEWLMAIAPHVRSLVKVLKYAAPLAGPVLGYALPEIEKVVKDDIELMKELIDKLPDIDNRKGLDPGEANERWPNPAQGAALRELRSVLDKVDQARQYGGLCKVPTPEGNFLWLCEEHAQPYLR